MADEDLAAEMQSDATAFVIAGRARMALVLAPLNDMAGKIGGPSSTVLHAVTRTLDALAHELLNHMVGIGDVKADPGPTEPVPTAATDEPVAAEPVAAEPVAAEPVAAAATAEDLV